MTFWLIGNIAWASLTMLLVLAVRRPVAYLFGAGAAYALWLLPAARLLLPPLPTLGADLSLLPPLAIPVEAAAASLPPDGGPGQWVPILLAIWAGGAAVFLVRQWLVYRRFLTGISLASRSLGAHNGWPLVESAAVDGPLALGLLDRRIVVPADFRERYTPAEQRLALDHEAVHHRRGDIWANLGAILVLALNWFNPVAWLAFRAFRMDQELACDAAVATGADPETRLDYARALVKSASRPGLIAACPLDRADQLKRRLKMMKDHRGSWPRTVGGAAALVVLGGFSLTLGSPGVAHPHPEGDGKHRERTMIIHSKAGDGDHDAHAVRMRHGDPGAIAAHHGCRDGGEVANIDEQAGEQRTRIVMCARGDASPAQRIEMLESARRRLAEHGELSAEQRQRIAARLDREIARLRGN